MSITKPREVFSLPNVHYAPKTVEIHPYLVCFHQKRLRYTRISRVFIKNKRLSSPEEGVYVRLGFVSDSERRRMVSNRIL